MSRPGDRLQQLVAIIERATNREPHITVESPKMLRDKDTGQLREHDVVLTHKLSHHTFLIALECRDRSRPVGVPAVEAFAKKCERTGVDKGIMVSSLGFASTAIKKAESHGIGCLSLTQAEGFEWCKIPHMNVARRQLIQTQVTVVPRRDPIGKFSLFDENGDQLGDKDLNKLGWLCLRKCIPHATESAPPSIVRCEQKYPSHFIRDEQGRKIKLRRLIVEVTYQIEITREPLEYREYADGSENKRISQVAIANTGIKELPGDIVLMRGEDGEAIAAFVPRLVKKSPTNKATKTK